MLIILCVAIALVAGLLSSRLMRLFNLPNVTGYLIVGLLIGPYMLNILSNEGLITDGVLSGLNDITTVALGFIAFSIGSSFKISSLKHLGKSVVSITLCQALFTTFVVDVVLILLGLVIDIPLPVAITLGAIATATAPAATLLVVRQYKAKGIVTDTLLPVVAFDDAIGLMVFSISLAIAEVLASGQALTFKATVLEPVFEILCSLALGAALGAILAFAMRFFKSRANRITMIIAAVLIGAALADVWNLSNLLVCMMIGALYCNIHTDNARVLEVMDRWTHPLFMLFFVLSGADLDLSVIPTVGLLGIAYILARSFGKIFGADLGARLVHADKNVKKYLGWTLLPQAGVAIGMAQLVITALPDYGVKIRTVVLCATLVYELVGPIVTKIALTRAGEIENVKKPKNSAPTDPPAPTAPTAPPEPPAATGAAQ